MPKVYLAEFTNKETNQTFQKFGHTKFSDAQIRLNYIVKDHPKYTAKVLASAYHDDISVCQGAEMSFHTMYPKNFWIEEKLSGITECVILNEVDRRNAIAAVFKLKDHFKHDMLKKQQEKQTEENG